MTSMNIGTWVLLGLFALACIALPAQALQTGPFPGHDRIERKGDGASLMIPGARPSLSPACRVTGKTKGLHPQLMRRLCAMSRALGPINVVSGCRAHGSKAAPKSFHRVAVGCKAADLTITGVSGKTILAYWKRTGGGGTGYYCRRSFVHVDIGPTRSWAWFC